MADDVPPPRDLFAVNFGDNLIGTFDQVAGLEPGAAVVARLTMRRGTFVDDDWFWNWHGSVLMGAAPRRKVTVTRFDASGAATGAWSVEGCWPTKVTRPILQPETRQVLLESVEAAYGKLTAL